MKGGRWFSSELKQFLFHSLLTPLCDWGLPADKLKSKEGAVGFGLCCSGGARFAAVSCRLKSEQDIEMKRDLTLWCFYHVPGTSPVFSPLVSVTSLEIRDCAPRFRNGETDWESKPLSGWLLTSTHDSSASKAALMKLELVDICGFFILKRCEFPEHFPRTCNQL